MRIIVTIGLRCLMPVCVMYQFARNIVLRCFPAMLWWIRVCACMCMCVPTLHVRVRVRVRVRVHVRVRAYAAYGV